MTVGRICSRETQLASEEEAARDAAVRMRETNVGTLVVIDAQRVPRGIVTDRDLALRVLGQGLGPETTVGEVMTRIPRTVSEETPIEDALAIMRGLGIRRMPVVGSKGRLVGMISVDDVIELLAEELGDLGKIIGSSHQGIALPTTRPKPRAGRTVPRESVGLERSSSDLQC
jgi:CBS domain-containing protein